MFVLSDKGVTQGASRAVSGVLNENKCVIIISGILSSGSWNGCVWSPCEISSVMLLGADRSVCVCNSEEYAV